MMTHAYQEIYLSNAQSSLGDAFDYAINTCKISGENFIQMLLSSSVCKKLENGEPNYLAGKSGIEIAREVLEETTGKQFSQEQNYDMSRSPEYWIGWAAASGPLRKILKSNAFKDFSFIQFKGQSLLKALHLGNY